MGKLKFTKMQGAGNDYIYFNCLEEVITDPQSLAKNICRRHLGIGADGIVLMLASQNADFRMRMFNADGSEAQMCGNAIRCVGKYLYEHGLTTKQTLAVETAAGTRQIRLKLKHNTVTSVEVNMGQPVWNPAGIPVLFPGSEVIKAPLTVEDNSFTITCLSMGNPHCVIFTGTLDDRLVHYWGTRIAKHPLFPESINVEFVKVLNKREVVMRVWERGTGETQACGTGASAVCAAGCRTGNTGREITCHMPGGDLQIRINRDYTVFMTGAAETVFQGEI